MSRKSDVTQSIRSLPPPESLPQAPVAGFLRQMWSPVSTAIVILIFLTAAGLIGLLRASRRFAVDPMLHEQYSGALRSLLTLDSTLNETVLKASSGLLPNYDPLVRTLHSLRAVGTTLQTGSRSAPYLSQQGYEDVRKSIGTFMETLSGKEQQVERFKSESAVLRNSQNYFPLAIRTFVDELQRRQESPLVAQQVEELLRQVSLFSLQPLPEHKHQIEAQLAGLERQPQSLQPPLDEDLRLIILHSRIILEKQHRIDESVREVLHFPTREHADAARRSYERHFHDALTTADFYRVLAAVLGVLLVALSASLVILKLRRSAAALDRERQVAENLLLNVLPKPIADRLKQAPEVIADNFPMVTVLFADLVGFSQLSSRLPAIELVSLLNRIFSALDLVAEKYRVEKIKTIGDAYMVVAGLPIARRDHADVMAEFALAALRELELIRGEREENLQFRIGINTGPVVAGVIGLRKFAYDLWGDTVNIASRMEMHGLPGSIQCSASTYRLLQDRYEFSARGEIAIKGVGPMQTYLLHGHKADPSSS